jgi:hypothetical protein
MPAKKQARKKTAKEAVKKTAKKAAAKTTGKSAKKGVRKAAPKKAVRSKPPKAPAKKQVLAPEVVEPVVPQVEAPVFPVPAPEPEPIEPKEYIECEHCLGVGKCSGGSPFDRGHHQGLFREDILTSCPDCLLAAGKALNSKKLVACRICGGTGKVAKPA